MHHPLYALFKLKSFALWMLILVLTVVLDPSLNLWMKGFVLLVNAGSFVFLSHRNILMHQRLQTFILVGVLFGLSKNGRFDVFGGLYLLMLALCLMVYFHRDQAFKQLIKWIESNPGSVIELNTLEVRSDECVYPNNQPFPLTPDERDYLVHLLILKHKAPHKIRIEPVLYTHRLDPKGIKIFNS